MLALNSLGVNKFSLSCSALLFLLRYGTELVLCFGGRRALAFMFTVDIRILLLVSYWDLMLKSSLALGLIIYSESAVRLYSIELLIPIGYLE